MSGARSDNPFDGLLAAVNRPTAPVCPTPKGAEPAAEVSSSEASAAFFSQMTESSPIAARTGQGKVAPAGTGASVPAGATTLSIELSPAVALILSLVTSAKGISADEAVSRGICVFAQTIGIPSLARQNGDDEGRRHANSESADLHAVPAFARRAPSRFKPFNRGE